MSGWGSKNDVGERFVKSDELRDVLIKADLEFASHLLWQMDRWSDDGEGKWAELLPEFFNSVWPKQKKVRTPQISARLCEVAFSQKTNFPTVARAILPHVSRVEEEHVYIPELRKTEDTNAFKHPKEMLDLLYAILPTNTAMWPYGASAALKAIEQSDASLLRDPKLIELKSRQTE